GDLLLLEPEADGARRGSRETRAGQGQRLAGEAALGAVPSPRAAKADLDAPDAVGLDHPVVLDRPGQPQVQTRLEVAVDDAAEAGVDADLARRHREDAVSEVEERRGHHGRHPEARRRQAYPREPREPVAGPEPLLGHRHTPEAPRE